MKVVINTCYGGFGLSLAGLKRYYEIKFPERRLYLYKRDFSTDTYTKVSEDEYNIWDIDIFDEDFGTTFKANDIDYKVFNDHFVFSHNIKRTDPALIQVVEELGKEANGDYAELTVVDIISNKYRICEYDGTEWIETPNSIKWEEVNS